jgi:hypothetical protein
MNTEQIEQLAIKHEAFGFGLVDAKGYTTHGFDPDGLHSFVAELTQKLVQERDALKATLAQPEQERVETYIHEFTKQPHPGDFGIPRGHWWQAKQYADSLQPEQEPDVVNRMNALQDPLPPTETKTRVANSVQPEQEKPWVGLTKESIRAAGGIVHGDGNIFFTNITQLQAALEGKS